MIRSLVVDDEKPARDRITRLLEGVEGICVVGQASNGIEALEQTRQLSPDVVFLDIEMPELNGMETARALGPDGPAIVFVTAYDAFALKAFEAAALDYLVKPISAARLATAVDRVRRHTHQQPDLQQLLGQLDQRNTGRLAVRVGGKFSVFRIAEVSAILATDHYATIICGTKEFLSEDSLDALYQRLNWRDFIRVHRSAIINLAFLESLERKGDRKFVAVLSDAKQTQVAVSRDKLVALKQRLGIS